MNQILLFMLHLLAIKLCRQGYISFKVSYRYKNNAG